MGLPLIDPVMSEWESSNGPDDWVMVALSAKGDREWAGMEITTLRERLKVMGREAGILRGLQVLV